MKVLHVSDLHQGLRKDRNNPIDPKTGIRLRVMDMADNWDRIVDLAIEGSHDLVLIAGDVFDVREPSSYSLYRFRRGLDRLGEAQIRTVIINGNHDGAPHAQRPSVVEVFARARGYGKERSHPLVYVQTQPGVVDVDGLRIGCLPWASRQEFMANSAGLMTRGEAVQGVDEALSRILDHLRAEEPHILTGHWSVEGAVLGSERDITLIGDSDVIIKRGDMEGPWRYVALGHLHSHQTFTLGDGTPVAYAGSIDRIDFGEEGEDKVAVGLTLTTGNGDVEVRTHPLPARSFITIDAGRDDPNEIDPAGAFIRIKQCTPDLFEQWRTQLLADGALEVTLHEARAKRDASAARSDVTVETGLEEAMDHWMAQEAIDPLARGELVEFVKQLREEATA